MRNPIAITSGRGAARSRRFGGSRFGPLLLLLPAAFGVGWALRELQPEREPALLGTELSDADAAGVPEVRAGAEVAGFEARGSCGPWRFEVRLAPLEAVPEAQAFVADRWGTRLGLPEGEPWRLDLVRGEGGPEADLAGLWIRDAEGTALRAPMPSATGDPRAVLLRPRESPLAVGARREMLLWGREPGAGVELVLPLAAGSGEAVLTLEPARFAPGSLPRWLAAPADAGDAIRHEARREETDASSAGEAPEQRGAEAAPVRGPDSGPSGDGDGDGGVGPDRELPGRDLARLQERVDSLEGELSELRARRAERELAWYEYNRALAALDIDRFVAAFAVDEELLEDEGLLPDAEESAAAAAVEDERSERERALATGVRSLLALEGFSGLDLLELGPPRDRGGAGPAVFRMLDDRGRLLGSLNAQTLRLEASRAARTITLVLEDGFESRGGRRTPFANGARRLLVPYVDPQPWIDALPELFPPAALAERVDDGRWRLEPVRREMNRLLALETSAGWWRLHGLGGVVGDQLRDVQLEQLGEDGRVQRRIFADRLRILLEDPGLLLVLEDGAIVRGEQKTPFVDGSYRLFLPRAPRPEWSAARLPGIAAPPGSDEDPDAGPPGPETAEDPGDGSASQAGL